MDRLDRRRGGQLFKEPRLDERKPQPKAALPSVVVLVADIVRSSVASRSCCSGKSWYLLTVAVFVIGQSIPKHIVTTLNSMTGVACLYRAMGIVSRAKTERGTSSAFLLVFLTAEIGVDLLPMGSRNLQM